LSLPAIDNVPTNDSQLIFHSRCQRKVETFMNSHEAQHNNSKVQSKANGNACKSFNLFTNCLMFVGVVGVAVRMIDKNVTTRITARRKQQLYPLGG